jgi:glucose-6-phosphate isomerase
MNTPILWKRFQQHVCQVPALGLTLDVSRMRFEDGFLDRMAAPMQRAFETMDALERGAIANPDEKRMVGHYWLRAPDLAPSPAIAAEIRNTLAEVKRFAAAVHDGTIQSSRRPRSRTTSIWWTRRWTLPSAPLATQRPAA